MVRVDEIMESLSTMDSADWRWFCIQTKPHCEDLATINLLNKQVTVFNPKIEEFYIRKGRCCRRIAPLFPSYIFANLVLIRDYYKVKWTQGVKRFVGSDDKPIPVDDSVIHTILDRLEGKEYIEIRRPKPGDRVLVRKGPFNGLIGIFESYCSGQERVNILLELLHQQVKVQLDSFVIKRL